jgi:glycosyltransferase involved in cell wall biosynthesis
VSYPTPEQGCHRGDAPERSPGLSNCKAPDISVVTICKNSAAHLSRAIDSVLDQQWEGDLEYVVVDGASSDATMEIVRGYGSRISKWVSEPDQGISDAFNKGIGLAGGRIMGFINSDDQLLPGALARVHGYFEAHPEVEVVHADLLLYDGERFLKRLKPPRYWWIPWRMILFNHPTTFVRREVYDKCGLFDTSYRFSHMDFELFLRWQRKGVVIHYLPEVLVRMQAGGASGRHIYHGFRENVRALKAHGYNLPLAWLQFATKHLAQRILDLRAKLNI